MKKENVLNSSYKCEKCKDTGWILGKRKDGTSYAYSCICREQEKMKKQWKDFGMNLDSVNLTFGNFKSWNKYSKLLKETAIAYFNDFNKIKKLRQNSLLLCGQPGSGKTHIAVATAINLMNEGVGVVYMPYRHVVTNIKLNFKNENFYKKELKRYERCDVLLIDDLFKGKISLSEINIIFEIVNYRYVNSLPMIISCENTIQKLLVVDEGIGSRIYEMCKKYMVTVPSEQSFSYRFRTGV